MIGWPGPLAAWRPSGVNASRLRHDIAFREAGPAFPSEALAGFSALLGVAALPEPHVQFMQALNGADPVVGVPNRSPAHFSFVRLWWPVACPAAEGGLWASLSDMHRLGTDPAERPELRDVHRLLAHVLPPLTFAFCSASGGSRFLFDLRPERFGQVLFWSRMERGDEAAFARNPYHNVAWVADDFIDFLNRIEVEQDDMDAWEADQPPAADMNWQAH